MARTQCDREQFVENLKKSGLLSARDFARAVESLPETDRGRVAARALVEQGVITKFQAELLLIGKIYGFFLGQYKILDQLGQGGMGRVYRAMHLTMKRIVALKVLAPQLVQTAKARKLFKREVRAAGQLHHPNIVTAFDANQINDRHYLVMEYVDGPSLDELVRRQGSLPVGLACEIIRQAACGLQHAHEMGLVHRDIKPANLLVQKPTRTNPNIAVKVLDFGLARLHEPSSSESNPGNTIMGTPDFLSPEQSRNLPGVNIRSDIYSLGCTFYYLLAGRVPFPGGTTLEKLLRHSTEDAVSVELFRSDVPVEVLAVMRQMMAKNPEDRQQTPADIAAALVPFASSGPVDLEAKIDVTASSPTPALPSSGDVTARGAGAVEAAGSGEQVGTLPPDVAPTSLSDDNVSTGAAADDAMFPFWMDAAPAFKRSIPWLIVAAVAALVGLVTGIGLVLLW